MAPLGVASSRPPTPPSTPTPLGGLVICFGLLVALVVPTVVVHHANPRGQPSSEGSVRQTALDTMAWLHWGLIVACQQVQAPLLAGLWRSPMYRASAMAGRGLVYQEARIDG